MPPIMTWNGTLNLKCFAKKESVKLTEGGMEKRVESDNREQEQEQESGTRNSY